MDSHLQIFAKIYYEFYAQSGLRRAYGNMTAVKSHRDISVPYWLPSRLLITKGVRTVSFDVWITVIFFIYCEQTVGTRKSRIY